MNSPQTQSHQPVLLKEVIQQLQIKPAGVYVDATFGRGGHAQAILDILGPTGRLFAIDKDPEAIEYARKLFAKDGRFSIMQGSFAMLKNVSEQQQLVGKVNGILFDLGVSSPQLDTPARGFSFAKSGPLDMRMDPTRGISAQQWLSRVSEKDLVRVLKNYGDEKYARSIARAICQTRQTTPYVTTAQLAQTVVGVVGFSKTPGRRKKIHPATQTFQAIRIAVNQELDDLEAALTQALTVLAPGGRLVVISFHSIEDRVVKRFIRRQAQGESYPIDLPIKAAERKPVLIRISGAVKPDEADVADNPRARSAVLRVAEKVQNHDTS